MAGKYKLLFSPKAANDLDQIYQYIFFELSAESAADKFMEQIDISIQHLCDFPYTHPTANDAVLKSKGYHKLPVNNFLLFYTVKESEKQVIIMRVIYGARQYDRFL